MRTGRLRWREPINAANRERLQKHMGPRGAVSVQCVELDAGEFYQVVETDQDEVFSFLCISQTENRHCPLVEGETTVGGDA